MTAVGWHQLQGQAWKRDTVSGQLNNPYEAVGVDQKGRAAIDWGVYGIPETFVIGRDATIRFKHIGPLDPVSLKKLRAEIDKAVKG